MVMEQKYKPFTDLVLPDLLLVEDLAEKLRLSKSAVHNLLRRGTLPGKKLGRRWVVERGALLRALTPTEADTHQLTLLRGSPEEDQGR